ncbi:hypothetical protein AALA90_04920 [Lachnospiraceae bacterium 38-10]
MNRQNNDLTEVSGQNKKKAVIIGCICGVAALIILLIALCALFLGKSEKSAGGGEEGEVNFDAVLYEPEFHPYDFLGEKEMRALSGSTTDTVTDDDYSATGTLYSASEDLYLDTTVYYHPKSKEIEMIWTIQDDGDHLRTYLYTFRNGKILEVIDMIMNGYDMDDVKEDNSFLFAEDCMVLMLLTDEKNEEGYIREMYELLDAEKQALYLEKEAEYLNRAYILYDAVSGW